MTSVVRIGPDWWRVVESPLDEEPGLCGLCDYENKTIFIRDDLGKTDQNYTLAHEITHAVFPDLGEDAVLRMEFALRSSKLFG